MHIYTNNNEKYSNEKYQPKEVYMYIDTYSYNTNLYLADTKTEKKHYKSLLFYCRRIAFFVKPTNS